MDVFLLYGVLNRQRHVRQDVGFLGPQSFQYFCTVSPSHSAISLMVFARSSQKGLWAEGFSDAMLEGKIPSIIYKKG